MCKEIYIPACVYEEWVRKSEQVQVYFYVTCILLFCFILIHSFHDAYFIYILTYEHRITCSLHFTQIQTLRCVHNLTVFRSINILTSINIQIYPLVVFRTSYMFMPIIRNAIGSTIWNQLISGERKLLNNLLMFS